MQFNNNNKKEVCRNFQRGSCRYGEHCKFQHVTQNSQKQSKPNVFGFGTQTGLNSQHNSQQQKPNPFGFGVQNSSQSKRPADYGPIQNQFKSVDYKWNRLTGSSASRQPDQPNATKHKCTDPESCKREIVRDFEHDKPLWELTCYGHRTEGPCDIFGDISNEELRAAAYDDVKHGLSLQSIVERERSLLNAKLIEFENLFRNPYKVSSNSILPSGSPIPAATQNVSSLSPQNSSPISVSSFSHLGTSLNKGFGMRSSEPLNSYFQQSNAFQNFNQTAGQFGTNNISFGNTDSGSIGRQLPVQTPESLFASDKENFGKNVSSAKTNPFSPSPLLPQIPTSASNQSPKFPNGPESALNGFGQQTTNSSLVNNLHKESISGDAKIWLKEKWSRGEIPEEAPPDAFV